ncbi:hypothetical protein RP75_24320 [Agrobacterium arsenijevicii]|jgi:hypothetical protein|uniref:Uncharacterized protein n=1 Tax=Agrobacterium arsenijevicii TaxID=1585697 RepID=A0ABR5D1B7_9HYPH|nr:hypothetical protein RP75_24320 [Agrobacterium arsenijevicii]
MRKSDFNEWRAASSRAALGMFEIDDDRRHRSLWLPAFITSYVPSSREPYGSTIVSKSGELVEQGSLL